MRRLILYLVVAIATFVIGVNGHLVFNRLTSFSENKEVLALDPVKQNPDWDVCPLRESDVFVISMADKGDIYLGSKYVGRINDTSELRISLVDAIAGCEKGLVQTIPIDITLSILKQKECKAIVYVKAVESARFGDVEKLIKTARESGAKQVGLVRRKSMRTNSVGRFLVCRENDSLCAASATLASRR